MRALGRGWRATPVSARVGVALAVATVVVALVGQHATSQRNGVLLHSEAAQGAAVITSSLSDATSAIDALSDTVTVTNGSTVAFAAQAQGLVHGPMSTAFAKSYLGRYGVAAAVGNAYRTGQVLDPSLVSSIHPAPTANPGPSVILGHEGTATFAAETPFVPAGDLVVVQVDLSEVIAAMTSSQGAFDGAQLTLYGSATPEPATALVSSGPNARASALTSSAVVTAGPDAWLLVVRAPSPLVGTFAADTPVIVLILGLVVAALAAAVIEMTARRRRAQRAAAVPVTPEPVTPPSYEEAATHQPVTEPVAAATPVPIAVATAQPVLSTPPPAAAAPPVPVVSAAPEPVVEPVTTPEPSMSRVIARMSRGMARPVDDDTIPAVPEPALRPEPVAADATPLVTALEPPTAAAPPAPAAGSPGQSRITLLRDDSADAGDDGPVFQDADWRPDPSGRYELRRYVAGQPTSLVRSGDAEQYDDVSALIERGPSGRPALRPPVAPVSTGPAPAPPAVELVRPAPPAVLSAYDAAGQPLQVDQDADAVINSLVARVTQSIATELKERGDDSELPWAVGDDSY